LFKFFFRLVFSCGTVDPWTFADTGCPLSDLFDPNAYEAVRRPLATAEALPPACYTSPDFHAREVERVFRRCWNIVGRADYAPLPGGYFAFELAGTPGFAMRGRDGEIRAFVNSCRHRGAKLLDGTGSCASIRCPYHSWIYDTEGRLRAAPGMADADDFRADAHGLVPLRAEVWMGFVFVNFDSDAAPLADYLGDLTEVVASYGLENMVTRGRKEFHVRSNWKCYVENSMENLHLPTVHAASIGNVKATWMPIIGEPGNYLILHSKAERSRATLSGDLGFERIPTLRGRAAEGAQYILIYPATVIGCDLDCMWFKQMIPDGPGTMRNIAAFCFPQSAVARPDFDDVARAYYRRYDMVIDEDNAIAERQFTGLDQPFARPGRLSSSESLVHAFDNWILDHVLGDDRARSAAQ
jgi:choline monooxygenase